MAEKFNLTPFREEHEIFRQQCRRFVEKELAPQAMEIEAARQLCYFALKKLVNGEPCAIEVSLAKVFASRMGDFVATTCLQLHGGYGYMREYEIERFFRDARINAIGGGTSEVLKEMVGRLMGL